MQRTVRLQLEKTTRGAIRYREVNTKGEPVDQAESVVGTLYLRKTALTGEEPTAVSVTITTE